MKHNTSKVSVDSVAEHTFKKELYSAQIRQTVTVSYAARKVNNSLFNEEEFNLETRDYNSDRMAWIDVPYGKTKEEVQSRLDEVNTARIQRILDLNPIFTPEERQARTSGIITDEKWEQMIDRQLVRNKDSQEVIFFNGKPQYRRNFFSLIGEHDIDNRNGGTIENTPLDENVDMEVGKAASKEVVANTEVQSAE